MPGKDCIDSITIKMLIATNFYWMLTCASYLLNVLYAYNLIFIKILGVGTTIVIIENVFGDIES